MRKFNRDNFLWKDLRIGDLVDSEVVDELVNMLPPTTMKSDCTQMGEPYDHWYDENKERYRPVFSTFKRVDGDWRKGTYEYCGLCFAGENVQRGEQPPYVTSDMNESMEPINTSVLKNIQALLPSHLRYKWAQRVGNDLYWVTQEPFGKDDLSDFLYVIDEYDFDNVYVILRDDSSYDFDKDIESGKMYKIDSNGNIEILNNLKEDYDDYSQARKNSNKLLDQVEERLIDKDELISELVSWMSDDDVGEFMKVYGYDEDSEEGEEDTIDESFIKYLNLRYK